MLDSLLLLASCMLLYIYLLAVPVVAVAGADVLVAAVYLHRVTAVACVPDVA